MEKLHHSGIHSDENENPKSQNEISHMKNVKTDCGIKLIQRIPWQKFFFLSICSADKQWTSQGDKNVSVILLVFFF